MKVKIYVISDKFEKFYSEGIKEYERRLSRYCKINWKQIKNEELLSKALSDKTFTISISVKGRNISSEDLAEKINQLGISGRSDISFVIGAQNFSTDEVISISPMEMDIGIKTIIMFEQIYRAYRILNNEPYHK